MQKQVIRSCKHIDGHFLLLVVKSLMTSVLAHSMSDHPKKMKFETAPLRFW